MDGWEQTRRRAIVHYNKMFVLGVVAVMATVIIGFLMMYLRITEVGAYPYIVYLISLPVLIYIGIRWRNLHMERNLKGQLERAELRRRDYYRHMEVGKVTERRAPAPIAAPPPPPMPSTRGPFQAVPLYEAGTCQSCGGTLFYGRLHCPHCSESIFQGAGEDGPPPEF
jgi:hypothetical protein